MSHKKSDKEVKEPLSLYGLKSKGRIEQRLQSLVDALGRLMFNCGLLELKSKNWVWEFETDKVKRDDLCGALWYERTKGLKKLIDNQSYNAQFKKKCHKVIRDSRKVMKFRNSVAHGSLVQTGDGEIKVLDSQHTKKHPNGRGITILEIEKLVDEALIQIDQWMDLSIEMKKSSSR